jgi:hypothetical protein
MGESGKGIFPCGAKPTKKLTIFPSREELLCSAFALDLSDNPTI